MSILEAIFLGLIHGVTEILPVGSSGHLLVFNKIFHNDSIEVYYDIMLHLATVVAILIAFREDVINMIFEIGDMFKRIFANCLICIVRKKGDTRHKYVKVIDTSYKKLILMVLISIIPTAVLGILGQGVVQLVGGTLWIVGMCFVINAVMLFLIDRHPESLDRVMDVPYSSGFLVGMAQGVSVVPGISRTVTTISMGALLGFNKKLAVKFSFIMAIPALIGRVVYLLINAKGGKITLSLMPGYIIGMIVAGITGFFALKLMLRLIMRKKYMGFAIYCFIFGVATIVISLVTK